MPGVGSEASTKRWAEHRQQSVSSDGPPHTLHGGRAAAMAAAAAEYSGHSRASTELRCTNRNPIQTPLGTFNIGSGSVTSVCPVVSAISAGSIVAEKSRPSIKTGGLRMTVAMEIFALGRTAVLFTDATKSAAVGRNASRARTSPAVRLVEFVGHASPDELHTATTTG